MTMKKILAIMIQLLIISLLAGISFADQPVTFQWTQGDPAPSGTEYRLFQRAIDGQYNFASPVWTGPGTTCRLTLPDGSYAFMVRAYIGEATSGDSNEVQFSVEPTQPPLIIPGIPKQLIIKFE
jgi:hypothetical protein